MATARLLAIDLDGTLLRSDGTMAPQDQEAIAAVRADGMAVTLATGRLSSSALPFAHALGLADPLVCADGAVLFCPTRGAPLDLMALPTATLSRLLVYLRRVDLSPFFFTHDTVLGAASHAARFPFVAGWTPNVVAFNDLDAASAGGDVITAIGLGSEASVLAAEVALNEDPAVRGDVIVFPLRPTDHWVVRLAPRGCNKAAGLERLVRRLGLGPNDVAAIGDWHNDLAMLRWAGFSFAMGQAPPEVKRAAGRTLCATASMGGGVAEAIEHLRGMVGSTFG